MTIKYLVSQAFAVRWGKSSWVKKMLIENVEQVFSRDAKWGYLSSYFVIMFCRLRRLQQRIKRRSTGASNFWIAKSHPNIANSCLLKPKTMSIASRCRAVFRNIGPPFEMILYRQRISWLSALNFLLFWRVEPRARLRGAVTFDSMSTKNAKVSIPLVIISSKWDYAAVRIS